MAGVGDYTNFFLSSTTVAGALTGLLFVAVSLARTGCWARRRPSSSGR